ncbi:MAG TPA: hypothetical protein DEF63_03695, partial [Cyanobacteria bacterium UBA11440]|nr:hypothetical protein [Cyanobacteria bacterium UBA11440]
FSELRSQKREGAEAVAVLTKEILKQVQNDYLVVKKRNAVTCDRVRQEENSRKRKRIGDRVRKVLGVTQDL